MKRATLWCLAAVIIFLIATALADETSSELAVSDDSAATDLADLAWMAGTWRGEAFGGLCEERWQQAEAGAMLGTFKLITDGGISFYEMMTITPSETGPVLRLKHFDADLTGWEEKDEVVVFEPVRFAAGLAEFDGLSYRRTDDDRLEIKVKIGGDSTRTVLIDCRRVAD